MNKDNIDKDIGYRLRTAREQQEIKGNTVARKLGFTASYLSQMENGKRSVSLHNLIKFSELYDKDVVYFLQDFTKQK